MDLSEYYYMLVGTDPRSITWWQMCVRGFILFLYGLLLLRLASNRAFSRATTFDLLLAVILGSVLSRALTGNAELLPAMAVSALLVGMHMAFAHITYRWHWFGRLVKGRSTAIMLHGQRQLSAMRRTAVTENDLLESARGKGLTKLEDIKEAYLERSGDISVIPKER